MQPQIQWEDIIRGLPHNEDQSTADCDTNKSPGNEKRRFRHYNHINIPNGAIAVTKEVVQMARQLNVGSSAILTPIGIVADSYRTGEAAFTDFGNKTTRNTVEAISGVAGGWGGGYGGAVGGAALGTAFFPGIGTIIGGLIGGLSGGISGALLSKKGAALVGDKLEYNIREKKCLNCGDKFKAREYLSENICLWCRQDNFICFVFRIR